MCTGNALAADDKLAFLNRTHANDANRCIRASSAEAGVTGTEAGATVTKACEHAA